MLNVYLVISSVLSLALLVLGLSVLVRNPGEAINKRFLLFTFSVAFWLITNYVSADIHAQHEALLIANRLVLIAGGMTTLTALQFIMEFSGWRKLKFKRWLEILNYASWILALTPYVVTNVRVNSQVVSNSFGILAWIYFATLFLTFVATVGCLIGGHFKLPPRKREQLDVIATSFYIAMPITLVANAIFPTIGYYGLVNISPVFVIFVVMAMVYVIVRHRLFDLRLVIARTLAYGSTLIVLAILYGLIVFVAARWVLNLHFSVASEIFLSIATGLAALSFSRLKIGFDKITNRLFYQDAYDPQDLYDDLNKALVSTLNLGAMSNLTADILATKLKSQFCLLCLRETKGRPLRITGTEKTSIGPQEVIKISKQIKEYHSTVITTDSVEEEEHGRLKNLLQQYNIAVIVKLTQHSRSDDELGYILMGPKKSGNLYTNQDVRVLDTVTKEMAIAIQNALHFEEIQNFNVTLQQKVVEATNKLRRTNDKLKAMDETKDDFISMASHQLRTPLTSVKGYLSMVLEGDAGKINPTQREMLGQAFFSSQRMVYLIADLLNVSRLKTGKFVIEETSVNLAEIVQQEMSQLTETAAAKQQTLTYHKPADFPSLMLDETKTRQVIMNFMDNAIYYTQSGGHIEVQLNDKPGAVELLVVDDGMGVPRSEQHHLFTKFYRAGNARRARPDGTGLGLYMAKKVVMAQDGAVIFQSKEGKGSTFGFTFSKSKLAKPTPTKAKS